MATPADDPLAAMLAAHVDGMLATAWDLGPQLAFLDEPVEPPCVEEFHVIAEPADDSSARLPSRPRAGACLSALGHVADERGGERRRARLTIVVTAAESAVVVRFEDGCLEPAHEASGSLILALRRLIGADDAESQPFSGLTSEST